MRPLADAPARPRSRRHRPAYPALAVAGVVVTACGGTGRESKVQRAAPVSDPVVVVASEPPEDTVLVDGDEEGTGGWTVEELVAAAPARFPIDDAEPPAIGCGGGCPPAYVLTARAMDRMQIDARLEYCRDGVKPHWPDLKGTVEVSAQIDEQGRAHHVEVKTPTDSPAPLGGCVQRLVEAATFLSEPPFARQAGTTMDLEEQERE